MSLKASKALKVAVQNGQTADVEKALRGGVSPNAVDANWPLLGIAALV